MGKLLTLRADLDLSRFPLTSDGSFVSDKSSILGKRFHLVEGGSGGSLAEPGLYGEGKGVKGNLFCNLGDLAAGNEENVSSVAVDHGFDFIENLPCSRSSAKPLMVAFGSQTEQLFRPLVEAQSA